MRFEKIYINININMKFNIYKTVVKINQFLELNRYLFETKL